jgi:septum formation protein
MHDLILASQSPRRRQILSEGGYTFKVVTIEISEILNENLSLDMAIRALAEDKLFAWLEHNKPLKTQKKLVLTADTVVVSEGRVLGKPKDSKQVGEFLRLLSGREHEVKTALCLYASDSEKIVSDIATTVVRFRKLGQQEVNSYVASGEGLDKAGGYGIQGRAGSFVDSIDGDYDTVVGMPLNLFERMLQENGWQVDRSAPIGSSG